MSFQFEESHLRSTTRPQATRSPSGHFLLVWTECGRRVPSFLVDNEQASCGSCLAVDRQLATQS